MDDSQGRPLNVSLLAGSGAHRAYYDRSGSSVSERTADALAAGFPPRPALNLRFFGGRTIAHLVFANHYLGGAVAWVPADIASIDAALAKAMTDNDLQSVIQQYYDVPISSRMLPSVVLPGSAPATIYKDQVEAVVARICRWTTPSGPATAPGWAGTPPAAARSATSRSRKLAPATPSSSAKSTWPTAQAPYRSSSCGPTRPAPPPPASPSPAACGTAWLPARH